MSPSQDAAPGRFRPLAGSERRGISGLHLSQLDYFDTGWTAGFSRGLSAWGLRCHGLRGHNRRAARVGAISLFGAVWSRPHHHFLGHSPRWRASCGHSAAVCSWVVSTSLCKNATNANARCSRNSSMKRMPLYFFPPRTPAPVACVLFHCVALFVAPLLLTGCAHQRATVATAYSTEATLLRIPGGSSYWLLMWVSRLTEEHGRMAETVIARPCRTIEPGVPEMPLYPDLKATGSFPFARRTVDSPNTPEEEVSVIVVWEGEQRDIPVCSVTIKLQEKIVSKTKIVFASCATNSVAELSPLPLQIYRVSSQRFVARLRQLITPKQGESDQDLLLRYFEEQPIKVQRISALQLILDSDCFVVRTTPESHAQINSLLSKNFPDAFRESF